MNLQPLLRAVDNNLVQDALPVEVVINNKLEEILKLKQPEKQFEELIILVKAVDSLDVKIPNNNNKIIFNAYF